MTGVTALLDRLHAGDSRAAGELFDRVYAELKRMAAAQVRDEAHRDVSPTELVHEAYLRLFPDPAPAFAGRAYFFAAAATAMRRVRVDHARAQQAAKRGGAGGASSWTPGRQPNRARTSTSSPWTGP